MLKLKETTGWEFRIFRAFIRLLLETIGWEFRVYRAFYKASIRYTDLL